MKRTALITGSSRGIGKAIALSLAKEGYNIIVNYINDKVAAENTAELISKIGALCSVIKADVSDSHEVKNLRQKAESCFGFIDTIVNNAGVSSYALLDRVEDAEYDRVMNVNMKGVFNVSREFYSPMVSKKFGRIINISSMWGITGSAMESVYSASKAAVIGFTKALAKELAPSGITVNAIAPGVINTDMLKDISADIVESLIEGTPVNRLGTPEDIASAVRFFASDSSGFITGEVLNVSGGFVI